VNFGTEANPILKRCVFELKPNEGLVVRKCGARKTSAKIWTFAHLANVARVQMELFYTK